MSKFIKQGSVAIAAVAAVLLAGCASSGMGGGEILQKSGPAEPVLFAWQSNDGGITGTLTATLPNSTYSGRFVQITRQTQQDSLAPMWAGWNAGWSDWPYWGWGGGPGMFDAVQFSTMYSGKVIANLQNASNGRMRCRLHMFVPDQGMAGGGGGECQIAGGATIQAKF